MAGSNLHQFLLFQKENKEENLLKLLQTNPCNSIKMTETTDYALKTYVHSAEGIQDFDHKCASPMDVSEVSTKPSAEFSHLSAHRTYPLYNYSTDV